MRKQVSKKSAVVRPFFSFEFVGVFELKRLWKEEEVQDRLIHALQRELRKVGTVPDPRGFSVIFWSSTAHPPSRTAKRKNFLS